jgi:hypothetical protein
MSAPQTHCFMGHGQHLVWKIEEKYYLKLINARHFPTALMVNYFLERIDLYGRPTSTVYWDLANILFRK